MKYIVLLFIIFVGSAFSSPEDGIDSLLKKHRKNDKIVEKLKKFEKSGCEYSLNIKKLNPDRLIKQAEFYLGTPHCMGGTTKKCMDCSGLLYAVFKDFSVQIPHESEEQARFGKIIPEIEKLKKGDLVFFIKSYNTLKFITHAGIYLGDNKFIHTSTKTGVSVTTIRGNSFWEAKFIFGTRIF